MLLGQLVAISVPANLFYLALVLSGREFRSSTSKRRPTKPSVTTKSPPLLWMSNLLSLITVLNSPCTDAAMFLRNLLLMHGLIVVPFLFLTSTSKSNGKRPSSGSFSIRYSTLYTTLSYFILVEHVINTLTVVHKADPSLGLFQDYLRSSSFASRTSDHWVGCDMVDLFVCDLDVSRSRVLARSFECYICICRYGVELGQCINGTRGRERGDVQGNK